MYQYRQIITRMRLGESDRQIAASGLMGRRTASALRKKADQQGWLDPAKALPPDSELFKVLQRPKDRKSRAQSSLEPYREPIEQWCREGIQGTTIYQVLKRKYDYPGSYSAVRRFLHGLSQANPNVTGPLIFAPGDRADRARCDLNAIQFF